MISAHAYPTFELSNAVQLLAKTASRERKLGPCPETPYCPETPSVTLLATNVEESDRAMARHDKSACISTMYHQGE